MVLLEVLNGNHDKLIWRRWFGGSAIWGSENGREGGRQLLHISDIGKYNTDLVIMMARQRRVTEEDDEDTDPGLTDPFLQVGLAIMLPGNPQKSCHHAAWWSSNLQDEEDSIVAVNGHIKQVNIDSPMTKLRILSFFVGLFSVCLLFEAFLSDISLGRPLQHTTQVFIVERHMIDLFLSSTLYFQKVCKLLWNLQLP